MDPLVDEGLCTFFRARRELCVNTYTRRRTCILILSMFLSRIRTRIRVPCTYVTRLLLVKSYNMRQISVKSNIEDSRLKRRTFERGARQQGGRVYLLNRKRYLTASRVSPFICQ